MKRLLCLVPLLALSLLTACENNAAAYEIDGRNHSISLVREQAYPFAPEIAQTLVASRFPECQRRYKILPGNSRGPQMVLWQLQDQLFVARQGKNWYAISTEKCLIQRMEAIADDPPGTRLGRFSLKDGALSFVADKR